MDDPFNVQWDEPAQLDIALDLTPVRSAVRACQIKFDDVMTAAQFAELAVFADGERHQWQLPSPSDRSQLILVEGVLKIKAARFEDVHVYGVDLKLEWVTLP